MDNLNNLIYPIYNGIDKDLFDVINQKDNEFTLGYVGRIDVEKGGNILMDIFNEFKDVNFIVAGSNYMPMLIPDHVNYLGWIDKDQLDDNVYSKCDFILLPSFYEGVPNVILESYLTNTKVIVSSKSIPYDIIVYGYVLPFNSKHWISLIKYLKDNYEYEPIDSRTYVINKFNWDIYGEKMMLCFDAILKKHHLNN